MTYMHACKYDASFFRTWRLQDGFGGLRRSRRACRSARGAGRAHGHWARRVGRSRSRHRGRSRSPKAWTQGHGGPKAQAVAQAPDQGLRSFSSVFICFQQETFSNLSPPSKGLHTFITNIINAFPMSKVFIQTSPPFLLLKLFSLIIFHFLVWSSLSMLEGFMGFPI